MTGNPSVPAGAIGKAAPTDGRAATRSDAASKFHLMRVDEESER
jgi:hypothetical protein